MCFIKVVLATDRAILGARTARALSAMGKPPANRHIQTGSVRAGLATGNNLGNQKWYSGQFVVDWDGACVFLKACAHWVDNSSFDRAFRGFGWIMKDGAC